MDTALPQQDAQQGLTQPAAEPEQHQVSQSLGDRVDQAPDPTAASDTASGAPESQEAQSVREELGISREEYEALQKQLAERDDMLAQIRRVAEEQQQQQREQQWQSEIDTRLQNELKRAIDSGNDDDIIAAARNVLNTTLGEVKQNYQSQINSYAEDVKAAFWAATMPGFAEDLVRQHNLPEAVKNDLLQFKTEQEMSTYALRVKAAMQQFQQQAERQAVEQQVQQRRESGVNAVGGMSGGTAASRDFEPGTAQQLTPALAKIFGMRT